MRFEDLQTFLDHPNKEEVQEIHLSLSSINNEEAKIWATALAQAKNLQKLSMIGVNLNDEGLKALIAILPELNNLQSLHIGGNRNITDDGVEALAQYFLGDTLDRTNFKAWGNDKENAELVIRSIAINTLEILVDNIIDIDTYQKTFKFITNKLHTSWEQSTATEDVTTTETTEPTQTTLPAEDDQEKVDLISGAPAEDDQETPQVPLAGATEEGSEATGNA